MNNRLLSLIELIDPPNREPSLAIYRENREIFESAPGSSHNHQAWPGGYMDHIIMMMLYAEKLYVLDDEFLGLPFSLSDALLCIYLHDIEKPWKFAGHPELSDKLVEVPKFVKTKLDKYGFQLSPEHWNGIECAEGEWKSYSPKKRTMGPLAAFVNTCDVKSARVWFDKRVS